MQPVLCVADAIHRNKRGIDDVVVFGDKSVRRLHVDIVGAQPIAADQRAQNQRLAQLRDVVDTRRLHVLDPHVRPRPAHPVDPGGELSRTGIRVGGDPPRRQRGREIKLAHVVTHHPAGEDFRTERAQSVAHHLDPAHRQAVAAPVVEQHADVVLDEVIQRR